MPGFNLPAGSCRSRNRQTALCRRTGRLLAAWILVLHPGLSSGGEPCRHIELSDGKTAWTGCIVARDQATCFLLDGFGRLHELSIPSLTTFRVVAPKFRPATESEFREQLLTDFPGDYEVAKFGRYIVCAGRGRARNYASLFDATYQEITRFYRLRGFEIQEPATPLVGVVLQSGEEFRRCCIEDGMQWSETLHGYYSLRTNRVVLFDSPPETASVAPFSNRSPGRGSAARPAPVDADALSDSHRNAGRRSGSPSLPSHGHFTIPAQTASTIVHETTHQVSFNIGIHSRIGSTPLWLVEGLAMVLEAPGMRSPNSSSGHASEINHDRLEWYVTQYEPRRQAGDLQHLIASDEPFTIGTLDAYSQSWALVWFLTENPVRARKFAAYIRSIAARDPFDDYSADERLRDFQTMIGDLARTEVQLHRRVDDVIHAP